MTASSPQNDSLPGYRSGISGSRKREILEDQNMNVNWYPDMMHTRENRRIDDMNMTTFSDAIRLEPYHVQHGGHQSKPSKQKRAKRLSEYISEGGYKLYRGFIGSRNHMQQHVTKVP